MIVEKVKLVVWDLDETFWKGTLTEGGIAPVARNLEIVRELSRRGIVNSICSKNDHEQAKATLAQLGIWDSFVFPHIKFGPKGQALASMLQTVGLRAENVLFIDDNPSNLEEAKFFNPGIMTAHPSDVLDGLLDHPHCAGTPDPDLKRLNQYRLLERRADERTASGLSNEDFLRASNIRVSIEHNFESDFDRVVELINRANQLNYTKRRLETAEEIERFRTLLDRTFHLYAGCVHASDRYGDYGLIGFFLLWQDARVRKLIHFVFSCRVMNMGIEQYVYEQLGRPKIAIAKPVSYGLDSHDKIDWINAEGAAAPAIGKDVGKLVLLGGCDLLQLASYCSPDRLEFVNRVQEKIKVRYEDPFFVLTDRAAVRDSQILPKFPNWTYEDVCRFDEGVSQAGLIILSMWPAMNGDYYRLSDGITVRINRRFAGMIRRRDPQWFDENFERLPWDSGNDRLPLIAKAFDALAERSRPDCQIVVLGAYTLGEEPEMRYRRQNFNHSADAYCVRREGKFHFVDQDSVIPRKMLVDKKHYDRRGYFVLAQHILGLVQQTEIPSPEQPVPQGRQPQAPDARRRGGESLVAAE